MTRQTWQGNRPLQHSQSTLEWGGEATGWPAAAGPNTLLSLKMEDWLSPSKHPYERK